MAIDFLLLQRYPRPDSPRFRHYEWRVPAFTFGYGQKIAFVREQIHGDEAIDLCRRPTGGGIVDHRDDWTYALVIPRGHALEESRATQSYHAVHEALAKGLRAQGLAAELHRTEVERLDPNALSPGAAPWGQGAPPSASSAPGGVCFQRAEIFDVVHTRSGAKIAGAAQKRNKHGMLFQGSIWRRAIGTYVIDWEKFEADFVTALGAVLNVLPQTVPWPEFDDDEVSGLIENYSSPEWIERR